LELVPNKFFKKVENCLTYFDAQFGLPLRSSSFRS